MVASFIGGENNRLAVSHLQTLSQKRGENRDQYLTKKKLVEILKFFHRRCAKIESVHNTQITKDVGISPNIEIFFVFYIHVHVHVYAN
jgi:hypothetical protein